MDKIICKNCQKEFFRHPSRKAQYCSNYCSKRSRRTPIINDFSKETPGTCYWAGFIFGDGHIVRDKTPKVLRMCLGKSQHAKEHLEKLSLFLLGSKEFVKSNDKRNTLAATSEELCKNLSKFGVIPNKTYKGKIILPGKYKYDFIRGYFDADGWASIRKHKNKEYNKIYTSQSLGFCSYRKHCMQVVKDTLKIKTIITKKNNQHLYELRYYSRKNVQLFYDLCYSEDKSIRYDYKWDKICKMPFLKR